MQKWDLAILMIHEITCDSHQWKFIFWMKLYQYNWFLICICCKFSLEWNLPYVQSNGDEWKKSWMHNYYMNQTKSMDPNDNHDSCHQVSSYV
jgi:hypothetical protein